MARYAQHLLTASRCTIVLVDSTLKTFIITRLGIGARLLRSAACTLAENVPLINCVALIALYEVSANVKVHREW